MFSECGKIQKSRKSWWNDHIPLIWAGHRRAASERTSLLGTPTETNIDILDGFQEKRNNIHRHSETDVGRL